MWLRFRPTNVARRRARLQLRCSVALLLAERYRCVPGLPACEVFLGELSRATTRWPRSLAFTSATHSSSCRRREGTRCSSSLNQINRHRQTAQRCCTYEPSSPAACTHIKADQATTTATTAAAAPCSIDRKPSTDVPAPRSVDQPTGNLRARRHIPGSITHSSIQSSTRQPPSLSVRTSKTTLAPRAGPRMKGRKQR